MRHRFNRENCSVARALEAIGDWWTLLLVREAMLGTRRFADFHLLVPGSMSVHEAHARTTRVEEAVRAALPGLEVTIHVEPIEEPEAHADSEMLAVERRRREAQGGAPDE